MKVNKANIQESDEAHRHFWDCVDDLEGHDIDKWLKENDVIGRMKLAGVDIKSKFQSLLFGLPSLTAYRIEREKRRLDYLAKRACYQCGARPVVENLSPNMCKECDDLDRLL